MSPAVPPFVLRDIDHAVLRARDVDRLAAFYVDVIGCTRERVAGDLTQLRAGNALIDLVPRDGDEPDGRNLDHLCLAVAGFDADRIAAWLASNGVVVGETATRYGAEGYGVSIYLTDPEGNGLELKAAAP
ncbi:MAG: VOC family protein [Rhizorhabdus sp.]